MNYYNLQGSSRLVSGSGNASLTQEQDQGLPPVEWNSTGTSYATDLCVPQLAEAHAVARPDAIALVAGDRTLTYGELDARANQLAHYLRARGVGPDVLVGICLERSMALVVGTLAILKAGGAYVPLDPAYPAERLAFMLQDAQIPVLVTRQQVAECLPAGAWRAVALDADAPLIARESSDSPGTGPTAGNLAYVIYTSGSTGWPKGVQITHGSLLNLVHWHNRAFAVSPDDRATQVAGPAFDATGWELWPYLSAGASIYIPEEDVRVTPTLLRDWLVANGITISFAPTALAEALLGLEWPRETALRILLTGADTLHRYPSPTLPFALINNYGPTESTVVATSGRVLPDEDPRTPPSIGRPIANTQVYILDGQLNPVPDGEPGELFIGGAGLARGYLNRPDLTAERFIPHPFSTMPGDRLYKTGDRGYYLPDGQIAFLGRIDNQIKIRGYRIEPDEIIAALRKHPAVQASVVIAREDPPSDKRLVAYMVPAPGPRPGAIALREYLGTLLPDYMVPATFVWLDSLPLTANGKVDSSALPVPDATNTAREDDFVAPRTPIEEQLTGILAGVLKLEQVGVHDNFFLLGGHSLLGTQVIARVSDSFGVDLPLYSLFASPTVAELSVEIEQIIIARLEAMSEDEVQRILG